MLLRHVALTVGAVSPSAGEAICDVVRRLDAAGADHTLLGRAAALTQGVQGLDVEMVEVVVQWDLMPAVHAAFDSPEGRALWAASPLQHAGACSWFWSCHRPSAAAATADGAGRGPSTPLDPESRGGSGALWLLVCCQQGTVVAADAHRVCVQIPGISGICSDNGHGVASPASPAAAAAAARQGQAAAVARAASGRSASTSTSPAARSSGQRSSAAGSRQAGAPAAGAEGDRQASALSCWARSLHALRRQARGLPSSCTPVLLPATAWSPIPSTDASPSVPQPWSGSSSGLPVPQPPDPALAAALLAHLVDLQAHVGASNAEAWGGDDAGTYEAWCVRFGEPAAAAARIVADPAAKLGPLYEHLRELVAAQRRPCQEQAAEALKRRDGRTSSSSSSSNGGGGGSSSNGNSSSNDSNGLGSRSSPSVEGSVTAGGGEEVVRVANLMGSHGSKAVAMALLGLGIQPTIVDVSEGNARYARELAEAAGVGPRLNYVVEDVLGLTAGAAAPGGPMHEVFHGVVMEMGILHYFVDLAPLMAAVAALLRPDGRARLVLRDFHPISTKLISSRGKKHKVDGDYFDPGLATTPVAFSKFSPAAGGEEDAATPSSTGEEEPALPRQGRARAGGVGPSGMDGQRRQPAASVVPSGTTDGDRGQAGASRNQSQGPGRGQNDSGRAEGTVQRAGTTDRALAHSSRDHAVDKGRDRVGGPAGAGQVLLRRWTLGEVVTAVAESGLVVVALEEEQGVKADDRGLPKAFTLVARKAGL